MTPKVLLLALSTMIVGLQTEARDYGRRPAPIVRPNPPRYPGPRPVPRPYPPPPVYPAPRPYPPPPVYYPPAPVYPSPSYATRVIYVNRYVNSNESLDLRYLAGLDSYYGYTVESVNVDLSGGSTYTNLRLLVNGYVADTVYSPYEYATLQAGYNRQIGYDISSLFLSVEGSAYIQSITINLRRY